MNFEGVLISTVLTALALLPVLEAVLRRTLHIGVPGSAAIVQHLTLIAGMLGAAIAAKEKRLMALSTLGELLKGRAKSFAEIFNGACAAGVTGLLCWSGVVFVRDDFGSSQILAGFLPVWVVEAIIPVGFALIAARMVWRASESLAGRGLTILLSGAFVLLWNWSPMAALIPLGLATLSGTPAFVTLAGVTLVLLRLSDKPIVQIPIEHYSLVTNPVLPTIPLFTLAGYLLAEGGAPKRLVRVFQTLLGRLRGGAAIMTACACAFFTSFTGGSGVTILALGGLLMPVLMQQRYKERDALGLVTGAGSLGLLFPPCLPLILYAIVANVPIPSMFLGGILPGVVLLVVTSIWGVFKQGPPDVASVRPPFDGREAAAALWEAKWELAMPVVALVALFGGFATPVQASALTALYALCIEVFIYHDLKLATDVPRVMTECGVLIGGVLLIQGIALGFTDYLVDADVMSRAADWATSAIHSPWVFLLALNLFLLLIGCMMEIYAAILIQAPLLVKIGAAFGIDPIHLGIIFLANLELGYLTPPVGLNLILSSYRFKKPIPEVLRASLPLTAVLGVGVLLITYIPALTTYLPQLFGSP